jgi:acetolactate synthase-1/2/3 large subunit
MTRNEWVEKCQHWKNKWPVIQQEYLQDSEDGLNLYAVLDAVNKYSRPEHVLMGDAGSISYTGPVALNPKENQRLVFSPAQADMGWALPAAIGVAVASKQPVISIIGDGSFMCNLQELAVAKQHDLNIAFVILNNGGYLSIKNTQQKYFEGRVYGTSSETGLWFPNFSDIALSFGIGYYAVRTIEQLNELGTILNKTGPCIIDCICTSNQEILPSQALKNGKQAGLHDLFPFLSDEELKEEMIVTIK